MGPLANGEHGSGRTLDCIQVTAVNPSEQGGVLLTNKGPIDRQPVERYNDLVSEGGGCLLHQLRKHPVWAQPRQAAPVFGDALDEAIMIEVIDCRDSSAERTTE